MKIFISKYALSTGIKQAETDDSPTDNYVYTHQPWQQFKIGRNAFLTELEAKAAAEKMRLAKIASLRSQIAKLQKLTF